MKKCTHNVVLDDEKHEYHCTLCGKVFPSVTTILKKHGLSADYSGVNAEVLKAKAERGTLIHKALEQWIKDGKESFMDEVDWFRNFVLENNFENMRSEQIVYNDLITGTVDFVCTADKGITIITDFKTSAKLDKTGVRWQLSLYAYLLGIKENFNLNVIQFGKDNLGKVIAIEPIPTAEIEKLLSCEKRGTLYQQNQITLPADLKLAAEKWERTVRELEQQTKQAAMVRDEYRAALVAEFERHGVDYACSIETDNLKITYVAATTRTTVDTTALKAKMPDIAKQFEKVTPIKSSVRVTIKGGAE